MLDRRELLLQSFGAALTFGTGVRLLGATLPSAETVITAPDLTAKDVCTLTCQQTLGPCYYDTGLIRSDIREGKVGLPTLLSFLVLNVDTCEPVANASIDIWHTDARGIYSAPINTMCNGSDLTARSQRFCRGIQFTDANGYARFLTVYPGWYSGRTTHIHATIRVNNTEMVTTQFYFDDALNDAIYSSHASYNSRPVKDTTNLRDNVIGGSASRVSPFLFSTKLIGGKSLAALKVIGIRTARTTCAA